MIFESVHFLYELAAHLNLGNRTTELGLILFHSFLAKIPFMNYNTKIVAAAALYLAWKMESPRPSTAFIEYTNNKRNPKNPELTLDDTRHQLFLIESKILVELDFDLEIEVPRTYLIHFDFKYKDIAKNNFAEWLPDDVDSNHLFSEMWAFLLELTSKLLNDTFYSPLWLYYHPAEIVAACLVFIHTYTLTEKIETTGQKPDTKIKLLVGDWYKHLHEDIDFDTVTQCAKEIDQLFGKL